MRSFMPCASHDGSKLFDASATAYTGASVALAGGVGYFGTFDNQVIAFDLKTRRVTWRYEHPDRKFPVLFVGGGDRRRGRPGRP